MDLVVNAGEALFRNVAKRTTKPLLYSLFTHDCVAMHASNSIIKFADDTTVVGLITNND